MFICNECLKKNFTNCESLHKSGGSCEICNERKVCNDIQSSRLEPRVKPMKPVSLDKNDYPIVMEPVMRNPQVPSGIIPGLTIDVKPSTQLIMDFDACESSTTNPEND